MTTVRVTTEEAEFLASEDRWNSLLRAAENRNVFLTFEWLATWWKHFKAGKRLHIVTVERDGSWIALAPLVVSTSGWIRTLHFLGRPGSDYSDFVVKPGEPDCVDEIVRALFACNAWDRLELGGIPEDSRCFETLAQCWKAENLLVEQRPLHSAPYLAITGPWEDYVRRRRKKLRDDNARQLRRLESAGKTSFESQGGAAPVKLFDELVRQKKARFEETGARDPFLDPRWVDFYRDVLVTFQQRGWLEFSRLRLNGADAALHFGFVYQNKFFFYMPSFDQRFAKLSVGRLLLLHLLERAHRDGRDEFDFLAGAEDYKYDWASGERRLYQFAAYPRTLKGFMLYRLHQVWLPALRNLSWARRLVRWQRRWRREGAKKLGGLL